MWNRRQPTTDELTAQQGALKIALDRLGHLFEDARHCQLEVEFDAAKGKTSVSVFRVSIDPDEPDDFGTYDLDDLDEPTQDPLAEKYGYIQDADVTPVDAAAANGWIGGIPVKFTPKDPTDDGN